MMKRLALFTLAAVVATAPTASFAQAQSPQHHQKPAAGDPNEVVCEKQTVTGSRLGSKRVCKTRAEWAKQRLDDRMEVDKTQVQRGSYNDGN